MNGEGELRKKLMRIGIPSYDWHNLGGQVMPDKRSRTDFHAGSY